MPSLKSSLVLAVVVSLPVLGLDALDPSIGGSLAWRCSPLLHDLQNGHNHALRLRGGDSALSGDSSNGDPSAGPASGRLRALLRREEATHEELMGISSGKGSNTDKDEQDSDKSTSESTSKESLAPEKKESEACPPESGYRIMTREELRAENIPVDSDVPDSSLPFSEGMGKRSNERAEYDVPVERFEEACRARIEEIRLRLQDPNRQQVVPPHHQQTWTLPSSPRIV